MNKLLNQIAKFGVVGVVCFLIDYILYWLLCRIFTWTGFSQAVPNYYLVAQAISFVVSMISNYLLSMRFVFTRKDDLSRQKEFIIFAFLSAIGLLINEVILYIGFGVLYRSWPFLQNTMSELFAETVFKVFATGVVMVYNFISRKMFLEKRE